VCSSHAGNYPPRRYRLNDDNDSDVEGLRPHTSTVILCRMRGSSDYPYGILTSRLHKEKPTVITFHLAAQTVGGKERIACIFHCKDESVRKDQLRVMCDKLIVHLEDQDTWVLGCLSWGKLQLLHTSPCPRVGPADQRKVPAHSPWGRGQAGYW